MAQLPARRGWRSRLWGELLAEYLGSLVLIAFGAGVVAVAVVGLPASGRTVSIFHAAGDWLLITWGWAFAVVLGVYVAGGVSGAHLNPAVSFAMALRGELPWKKLIPYWVSQVAGCFTGAAIVYWNYYRAIDAYNQANHVVVRSAPNGLTTFSIFATFPAKYYTGLSGPLLDEILGTFFLVLAILAINDTKNLNVQANLGPFIVGIVVAAVGMSFGVGSGYAINPARDFGPRLFTWLAGWGANAFPGPMGYWWVPIVGPLLGGGIAAFVYRWLIERTLAERLGTVNEEHSVASQDEVSIGR
ncbi:MAG: aquaporin family protein [Alicyclobacillus herbarius]|uniref:MIP/aquaporin family protein n=1 Tax=Alicyclobacillus herbarius TaxID=122960 RepID=UPI00047AFBFC|nr:MIP/aquaporin family protein [Alicyclobacillus herbarius]MCL6633277.1 aquaporin family protein [Alicyclobacillus herbarius]